MKLKAREEKGRCKILFMFILAVNLIKQEQVMKWV